MAKKVLLARPHAFIVSEMLPFLSRASYTPQKLESLAELESLIPSNYSGVVISTAVVSSINASADEVFAAVRRKMPRVPVIFAGLTEFRTARAAVDRIVRASHPTAEILPVALSTVNHATLGRENVFVVINKEDLSSGATAANAESILRRHFN